MRRLWELWRRLGTRRHRQAAWAIASLVAAVGLWRVESTAQAAENTAAEAQATADQLSEVVADLEAERVDRCVDGRGDIRSAIVRVVDDFTDLPPSEIARLGEVVEDELPTASCAAPP